MPLTPDKQALVTRLGIPDLVVAIMKAAADRPLQGIHYVYEREDTAVWQLIPLLCVTFAHAEVDTRVRALQTQLRAYGYVAFIMAHTSFALVFLLSSSTEHPDPVWDEHSTLVSANG